MGKIFNYFKNLSKIQLFKLIYAILTGIAMLTTIIIFKISILRVIPLFISLVVMFIQSSAGRLCYLIGGLNCILYSISYFLMKVYGMAIYSLSFAFPIQIITFIRWNKRSYKHSTTFNKMSPTMTAVMIICSIIVASLGAWILTLLGSSNGTLDSFNTVLAIISNVLSLLCFVEYTIIAILSNVLSLGLFASLIVKDIASLPFLIQFVYNITCLSFAFVATRKLYKEQNKTAV